MMDIVITAFAFNKFLYDIMEAFSVNVLRGMKLFLNDQ